MKECKRYNLYYIFKKDKEENPPKKEVIRKIRQFLKNITYPGKDVSEGSHHKKYTQKPKFNTKH